MSKMNAPRECNLFKRKGKRLRILTNMTIVRVTLAKVITLEHIKLSSRLFLVCGVSARLCCNNLSGRNLQNQSGDTTVSPALCQSYKYPSQLCLWKQSIYACRSDSCRTRSLMFSSLQHLYLHFHLMCGKYLQKQYILYPLICHMNILV